tara:strand:- start:3394 stop:3756 length:363 start_codon:yes stop_codon:yes gene_type:complete
MAKVKVNNMNELFSQVLSSYGELIRTPDLREHIAEQFIQACEQHGVEFQIDESKLPEKIVEPTVKEKTEKEKDLIEKERLNREATRDKEPDFSSVKSMGMKQRNEQLMDGIKKVGKTSGK